MPNDLQYLAGPAYGGALRYWLEPCTRFYKVLFRVVQYRLGHGSGPFVTNCQTASVLVCLFLELAAAEARSEGLLMSCHVVFVSSPS